MLSPLISITAALMLQAQTDNSVSSASEQKPSEQVISASGEEVICKRTAIVGSKFKKRMCATAQQWEDLSERGEDITRRMKRARGSTKGG